MASLEDRAPDDFEEDENRNDQVEEEVDDSRSYGEEEELEEQEQESTTSTQNNKRRGHRQRVKPQATNISPGQVPVPEVVKQFVTYLHKYIKDKNNHEVQNMYESSFHKITEKYFKQSPWPLAESIAANVNNDSFFLILYKEMYFRHIYSKMLPTLEQRIDSWKNYCDLFSFILNASEDDIALPNQWIWDMIDEFIYQYQAFCQYRAKLKNKSQEELTLLNNNLQVWSTISVINYLQNLVAKSKIIPHLESDKTSGNESADSGNSSVLKMIGFFSLIGLLRIHCLHGDYYLALKTINPININTRGLLTKVTGCHVTFFYYLGFVYMMMRRYVDAIRTFSTILLYANRVKQYHNRTSQYEQVLKKNEQMYGLLAISLSLCPQRVDENVHSFLREKYSDKMQRMQKGGEESYATYEEIFIYACPKFINPAAPNYSLLLHDPANFPHNSIQEPLKLQTKLFLNEVKQQALLPTIRSYLKLYTTIPVPKSAGFLELDQNAFKTQLLCYKHKMRGIQTTGNGAAATGSSTASLNTGSSGDYLSSSDVDFYVDKDMIHIRDAKMQRKYSEFFVRHINKFESIITDLATH